MLPTNFLVTVSIVTEECVPSSDGRLLGTIGDYFLATWDGVHAVLATDSAGKPESKDEGGSVTEVGFDDAAVKDTQEHHVCTASQRSAMVTFCDTEIISYVLEDNLVEWGLVYRVSNSLAYPRGPLDEKLRKREGDSKLIEVQGAERTKPSQKNTKS